MSDAKWYRTGKEGEERSKEFVKERYEKSATSYRFYLKPGNEAKVTFLDSKGFYLAEHNLKIGGRWGNYYTCLQEFDNCPLCDSGSNPSYICVYTVIDHSKYESKKTPGKIITNQKRLMVVKSRAHDKLKDRRDNQADGDLTYGVFRFKRYTKEECSTGEDILFVKKLPVEVLQKFIPADLPQEEREDYLKPFDYMKLFAPKTAEELRRVVGAAAPVGSLSSYDSSATAGSDGVSAPAEDDLDKYL